MAISINELTVKSAMVSVLVNDLGKQVKFLGRDCNAGLISAYKSDMLKRAYRSACSLAAALDALSAKERIGG
jgi:hypothetical protein